MYEKNVKLNFKKEQFAKNNEKIKTLARSRSSRFVKDWFFSLFPSVFWSSDLNGFCFRLSGLKGFLESLLWDTFEGFEPASFGFFEAGLLGSVFANFLFTGLLVSGLFFAAIEASAQLLKSLCLLFSANCNRLCFLRFLRGFWGF